MYFYLGKKQGQNNEMYCKLKTDQKKRVSSLKIVVEHNKMYNFIQNPRSYSHISDTHYIIIHGIVLLNIIDLLFKKLIN